MPSRWYAASLQSNHEQKVSQILQGKGVEYFLPAFQTASRRTDRKVTLIRPLFPGYVFVRLEIPGRLKNTILRTPGVSGFVSFSGVAAPIEDEVIESLQIVTGASSGEVRPHPLVKSGQKVKVLGGPFRDATGILCEASSKKKQLVIEVKFLGRAVSVPIDPDQVMPVV